MINYIVTTNKSDLPDSHVIVMLDGTVPGWTSDRWYDLHIDHHKPGGAKTQIEEITTEHKNYFQELLSVDRDISIVTTQLDADACVAAAYIQLGQINLGTYRKLQAIAYECDHLGVPNDLRDLADFAFKVVATFKVDEYRNQIPIEMRLDPKNSKNWTAEQKLAVANESFKRSTQWLIDAAESKRPYPGESGEADQYAEKLKQDAQMLVAENRVFMSDKVLMGNGTGLGYVDPRSFILAWQMKFNNTNPVNEWSKANLTYRDHKNGGIQYTIASRKIDLTSGIFHRLTGAELYAAYGTSPAPNVDGWGGRADVGGSGWNTPSLLDPFDVAYILNKSIPD